MTEQEQQPEDTILDLTDEVPGGDDTPPEQHDEPEEYSLEIEGDEPDEDAAIDALPEEHRGLPKKLRDQLKAEQREKHDLQRRLTALEQGVKPAPIEVGEKPTLDGCDYDGERFEAELAAWHDRKRAAESVETDQQRNQQAQQAEYQKREREFFVKLAAIRIPADEKETALQNVAATLPLHLQNAVVKYAKNPALVSLTLGQPRYADKLAKLAAELDPFVFMREIYDLEGRTQMKRKAPPAPESGTIVRGSAPISGNTNKTLEKLEAEAAKTGDRSKLIAARHRLRAA